MHNKYATSTYIQKCSEFRKLKMAMCVCFSYTKKETGNNQIDVATFTQRHG